MRLEFILIMNFRKCLAFRKLLSLRVDFINCQTHSNYYTIQTTVSVRVTYIKCILVVKISKSNQK